MDSQSDYSFPFGDRTPTKGSSAVEFLPAVGIDTQAKCVEYGVALPDRLLLLSDLLQPFPRASHSALPQLQTVAIAAQIRKSDWVSPSAVGFGLS